MRHSDSLPGTSSIDPASIPDHVELAAIHAVTQMQTPGPADMRVAIAAALNALGCKWDDDNGNNSHRRIVGAWVEKED